VLRALPKTAHPDLLVGFDSYDDAGVFRVSESQAIVQTMDFFTPVVDDPYMYGAIAAANALSDVYAMGGKPITAMNICCFDPAMAPPEVWAAILKGMADKVAEAGAVTVGGHSVEDSQPKFGLSVTGIIDPSRVLSNAGAKPGDAIYLSKPLGTGIATSALKWDDPGAGPAIEAAVASMAALNREASERAVAAGAKCATDITGFGLGGHLWNVARASGVAIEIDSSALPVFPGIEDLVARKNLTGGSRKNREFIGDALTFAESVPEWLREVVVDPQTSGGLAVFSAAPIEGSVLIGRASAGTPAIRVS
jgi:selenide,water dikinase